jgi:biotin carboxyl carrier protein
LPPFCATAQWSPGVRPNSAATAPPSPPKFLQIDNVSEQPVRVQLGDAVKKGQPLVIVEAMKMEHTIVAPADGKISAINANVGEQVDEKRELIALE